MVYYLQIIYQSPVAPSSSETHHLTPVVLPQPSTVASVTFSLQFTLPHASILSLRMALFTEHACSVF